MFVSDVKLNPKDIRVFGYLWNRFIAHPRRGDDACYPAIPNTPRTLPVVKIRSVISSQEAIQKIGVSNPLSIKNSISLLVNAGLFKRLGGVNGQFVQFLEISAKDARLLIEEGIYTYNGKGKAAALKSFEMASHKLNHAFDNVIQAVGQDSPTGQKLLKLKEQWDGISSSVQEIGTEIAVPKPDAD